MRRAGKRGKLTTDQVEATGAWIASQQQASGEIPWFAGGKMDPWDHVHAAMGLAVARRHAEARASFRFLAHTQQQDGSWAAERVGGKVSNATRETNHAAYVATGLWHLYCAKPDPDFLAEMWPTVERAIDFVVRMQEPCGGVAWALDPEGRPWRAPLLTGSSSIHGSLVCAVRIAERLGHERPAWRSARARVAGILRYDIGRFERVDLPERPGRHSMDWYYPVLGGALRGRAGKQRLLDADHHARFLEDGVGCRCVEDRPWYTVAESCELALAFEAVGLVGRARQILTWMRELRTEAGAYWTGTTHPDGVRWPEGEQTTWTAATVLLADDALAGDSATSAFFRDLAGEELEIAPEPRAPKPEQREVPSRLPSVGDDGDTAFDA